MDLIPDCIPVLGMLDDALLVPAGVFLFRLSLPPGLWQQLRVHAHSGSAAHGRCKDTLRRRLACWGILAVAASWILSLLLLAVWWWWWW